mgnify:FL=1
MDYISQLPRLGTRLIGSYTRIQDSNSWFNFRIPLTEIYILMIEIQIPMTEIQALATDILIPVTENQIPVTEI